MKTLKELEEIINKCNSGPYNAPISETELIRNTGINWLKEIRKQQKEHATFKIGELEMYHSEMLERWIIYFFNIEEKEVKK